MTTPKVFISYSRRDAKVKTRLVRDLQALGISVWVDVIKLQRGDFIRQISQALADCEWFVLLLSPSALRSRFVRAEVNAALNLMWQKRLRGVLVVLVAPVALRSIPAIWRSLPAYDATANYASSFTSLTGSLGLQSAPTSQERQLEARTLSDLAGAISRREVLRSALVGGSAMVGAVAIAQVIAGQPFTWLRQHGLGAPTSSTLNAPPIVDLSDVWHKQLDGPLLGVPQVAGNSIVLGGGSNQAYALHTETGDAIWGQSVDGTIASSVCVVDQSVYLSTIKGSVFSLDMRTSGDINWHVSVGTSLYSSPKVVGSALVIGSDDGYVYCLDSASGTTRWRTPTGAAIQATPTIVDSRIFIGSDDHMLYAFPLETTRPEPLWRALTGGHIRTTPQVSGNMVIVGSEDGSVYALQMQSGQIQWTFPTRGPIEADPLIIGGLVMIASTDSTLYAVDVISGKESWHIDMPAPLKAALREYRGMVFVGCDDGTLYAVHLATHRVVGHYLTPAAVVAAPTLSNQTVYVGSTSSTLYKLSTST